MTRDHVSCGVVNNFEVRQEKLVELNLALEKFARLILELPLEKFARLILRIISMLGEWSWLNQTLPLEKLARLILETPMEKFARLIQ